MSSDETASRAQAICERIRELRGEARSAYIEGACGGDAELYREVEVLIATRAEAETENAASASTAIALRGVARPTEGPGTLIGPYKILQEIGEGGFGVVYMAQQQQPVKRTVALKIIKLGMDTKQVIGRFEAERQALAMMDHPNIARVLDAGATETGRPFFVMELVKGVPITDYCDTNSLSTNERLTLFGLVCNAVQHAHQKGIIHRDIKPSNVMVTLHDGKPVPKVIDFGIAKATNQELTQQTVFTEYRQFLGTPQYMSPEQAEMSGLDVDTRTDIYSLGVLLYELLTGTTPFDPKTLRKAAYGELHRIIREQDPDKPSTRVSTLGDRLPVVARQRHSEPAALSRTIRGDLDWIAMKALEKDRTRRYETANGLALDITRYLADEPVLARPPRTSYRLAKFVRRNRAAVIGGGFVLAAILLGATLATVGFVQAKRDRDRALEAEAIAAEQRDRAQAAEEKSRMLRQLFGGDAVSLAVLPLENVSGDAEQDYFADGMTETLISDLSPISALHVIPGSSVMRYKGADKSLAEIAGELHVDAILKASVARAGDSVRISAELVHVPTDRQLWADTYEGEVRDVVTMQRRLSRDVTGEIQLQLTPQDQATLAAERVVDPEAHEAYLKGIHALNRQNEDAAIAALAFFEEAIRKDPTHARAFVGKAHAYLLLENSYRPPLETMPQMEAAAMKAIEIDPMLADAHVALGFVQLMFDWEWEEARRSFDRALELDPGLAAAHLAYASYLTAADRGDDAIAAIRRAEALDPLSLVSAANEAYGLVPFFAGRYELTIDYMQRSLDIDPGYWQAYTWLGLALAELGRFDEAIAGLETAWKLDDSPTIAEFLGGIYARAGDTAKAREWLAELDRQGQYRFICPYELATIHLALSEIDRAFELFDLAYETRSPCIPWLTVDPRLEVIRDDPRYVDLLQRVNLPVR